MEPIELKAGDACPACGGDLRPMRTLNEEQYRAAFDKENPVAVQLNTDTASPKVRAELGDLHRCATCGYQARFMPAKRTPASGARGASGARKEETRDDDRRE